MLLPEAGGKPTAVTVTQGGKEVVLDQPYAGAQLSSDGPKTYASDATQVKAQFGPALDALPARPTQFTLYFVEGKDEFTEASRRALDGVLAEIAARPVPDVIVVGHTDSVGSDAVNDPLSRQRAEVVRRALIGRGVAPENIAFIGDSAGAYLVFITAIFAARRGLPMPGAIVSMAPLTDFDVQAKIDAPSGSTDVLFSKAFARAFHQFVMRHSPPDDEHRLLDADLGGLPPSLIQVSSTELLNPDAEELAVALTKAGVPHQLQVWRDQVHVFQAAASIVPEAARALREVTQFIESAFARNGAQEQSA